MLYACSATKEQITVLAEPIRMSLDDCLEYVADDELVEVRASTAADRCTILGMSIADLVPWLQITPLHVRMRKNPQMATRKKASG